MVVTHCLDVGVCRHAAIVPARRSDVSIALAVTTHLLSADYRLPGLDVVARLDTTVEVPDTLLVPLREALLRGDTVGAGALVPDELLDKFAFAGDPDAVAQHAAGLFDAGASRVEFGTPHGRTDEYGVELIGKKVLPALREWAGVAR